MSPEEALEIAVRRVAQEFGRPLRPMGGACRDRLDARRWVVVFEFTTRAGAPCDGPVIVRVDDKSGEVEFL